MSYYKNKVYMVITQVEKQSLKKKVAVSTGAWLGAGMGKL